MRGLLALALCVLAFAPPRIAKGGEGAANVNPLAREPLARFSETLGRPLFSSTRRPPPPSAPIQRDPPALPPPEPPRLALVGVLSGAGEARAFVRPNPTDKIRSVKVGDEIFGWIVTEIAPQRIVVSREAQASAFVLFDTKARSVKTAASAKSNH